MGGSPSACSCTWCAREGLGVPVIQKTLLRFAQPPADVVLCEVDDEPKILSAIQNVIYRLLVGDQWLYCAHPARLARGDDGFCIGRHVWITGLFEPTLNVGILRRIEDFHPHCFKGARRPSSVCYRECELQFGVRSKLWSRWLNNANPRALISPHQVKLGTHSTHLACADANGKKSGHHDECVAPKLQSFDALHVRRCPSLLIILLSLFAAHRALLNLDRACECRGGQRWQLILVGVVLLIGAFVAAQLFLFIVLEHHPLIGIVPRIGVNRLKSLAVGGRWPLKEIEVSESLLIKNIHVFDSPDDTGRATRLVLLLGRMREEQRKFATRPHSHSSPIKGLQGSRVQPRLIVNDSEVGLCADNDVLCRSFGRN